MSLTPERKAPGLATPAQKQHLRRLAESAHLRDRPSMEAVAAVLAENDALEAENIALKAQVGEDDPTDVIQDLLEQRDDLLDEVDVLERQVNVLDRLVRRLYHRAFPGSSALTKAIALKGRYWAPDDERAELERIVGK